MIIKPPCRIPAEIIKAISARQAWEYRIVPYGVERGILYCLGESSRVYGKEIGELEARCGNKIRIESIPGSELKKLLKQYYRI